MLSNEKWAGSVDLLKGLAEEYNTRLTAVQVGGAAKAAGDMGMGGLMRLNSAKLDVTIHEFAHSIAFESLTKFGVEADDAFWKEIKAVRRAYKKDVGMDTTRWISFYEHSNKSVDEFLAEAFTQAKAKQLGLSLPSYYGNDLTYSNKVLAIVNKYFKKPLANSVNGSKIKMDNVGVRRWYIEQVSKIPEGIDDSMVERAKAAFEARNKIRSEARDMMLDEETRKKLEKEHPNKTFEELVEFKMKRKGMTREEAIADIYKTATKTNADVNKELGIKDE